MNSATWPDPHAGAPAPPRIEIRGIQSAANMPDAPLSRGNGNARGSYSMSRQCRQARGEAHDEQIEQQIDG